MPDRQDEPSSELPEELRHIAARTRALTEKCPAVATFLDNVLFMLERVELTDRMIEDVMVTFRFCHQHPDLALIVASFAQLAGHESEGLSNTP